MAGTRPVTFVSLGLDGEPLDRSWTFELKPDGGYDGSAMYLPTVERHTPTAGVGRVNLWFTDEGETATYIECTPPLGKPFRFYVPRSGSSLDEDGNDPTELSLMVARSLYPAQTSSSQRIIEEAVEAVVGSLPFTVPSTPYASERVGMYVEPDGTGRQIPANFLGSRAARKTEETAATVWTVEKNEVEVGTITFDGDVTFDSADLVIDLAPGDVLEMYADATPDATLSDIAVTIKCQPAG